jgi:tellurite resistance protein TerC
MSSSFLIIFHLVVAVILALDLFVFNRKSHVISIKESLLWSALWILLALLFDVYIYFEMGTEAAFAFLTGYLLEKSLSIDNLFVFLLIFSAFAVPRAYQHKVLFWGILGAIVMRAAFIFAGIALIEHFHFTIYLLGAVLLYSGFTIFRQKDEPADPADNFLIRWLRRTLPVTSGHHQDKFWVKKRVKRSGGGKGVVRWYVTPLFVALLAIEISDIIFAIDSVPAILAITTDPFIAYTSNIFAILGLRALYFAVDGMIEQFHYLKYGLAIILMFVGVKLLLMDVVEIKTVFSLLFILLTITTSIALSVRATKHKEPASHAE